MAIAHPCCVGLGVHERTIRAPVLRITTDGEVLQAARSFGTMTADMLALGDGLATQGVTHVAMGSTGVYWKPVYHVLEGRFDVMPVNAQHLKRVPGRKTDVKDAEWIAQLLQHGLLAPSSIPPPEIRELRDLTRQRTIPVRERAAVADRIQELLGDADIEPAGVAGDPLGVSRRVMIRALIAGRSDPEELAELARRRLRAKLPALRRAAAGFVTERHRFLLRMLMDRIGYLERAIGQFDARIEEAMRPFTAAADRLEALPGVGRTAAQGVVAEIGTDMARFPTAGHLASGAGMCPGNDQSAGKRRGGETTEGNQWLRSLLVQVAWAAVHTKGTIFQASSGRWAKRMGRKKALVAVGHKILGLIYTCSRTKPITVGPWPRHRPPETLRRNF